MSSGELMAGDALSNVDVRDSALAPDDIYATVSLILLLLTLLWLPIPKAGNMLGALPVLGFSMALVCGLFVFSASGYRHGLQHCKPWLAIWLLFSLCSVAHLFLVPWFYGLGRFFSVENAALFGGVGDSIAIGLPSLRVWFFFTIMWMVAWRVSLLSRRQIRWLLLIVFLASLFQAVFGLSHFISGASSVFGLWDKQYYLNDATGTFVNRNHFSGMLAICWPLVLSGLLATKPLLFGSYAAPVRYAIAGFYSMIIVVALVTSHSRMGTTGAFFGLIVWGIFYARSRRIENLHPRKWLPWAVGLFSILFAIWFGIEDILERYTKLDSGDGRTQIWSAIFDLPARAWLVGIGPGNFEDVFHLVQPDWLNTRTRYAHNDYLEIVLEFGVVLSTFLLCAFLFWLRRCLPRGDWALRAGALGSLAAMALHSIVDFNLQIPGSAIFFWVAVGLLMNRNLVLRGARLQEKEEAKPAGRRRGRRSVQARPKKKTRQEWLAFFRSDN